MEVEEDLQPKEQRKPTAAEGGRKPEESEHSPPQGE